MIPFNPGEDLWNWDTNMNLNFRQILNFSQLNFIKLEVEPKQEKSKIYFVNYFRKTYD